jgi:hypothetical protein
MSAISRRAAMLAVPAAAAGSIAGSIEPAQASPGEQVIAFTTKRSKNTLPLNPPLGAPFIIYLSLYDTNNTVVGDGSVTGMVVDVIVAVPPEIVVQVKAIFRLPGGEIHCGGMQIRKVPEPGTRHPLAIDGGTGIYRSARGEGTLEYTTADVSTVRLTVVTD